MGYAPRVLFKHPSAPGPGPDIKGKRSHFGDRDVHSTRTDSYSTLALGAKYLDRLPNIAPRPPSPPHIPSPSYSRSPLTQNDSFTQKQASHDMDSQLRTVRGFDGSHRFSKEVADLWSSDGLDESQNDVSETEPGGDLTVHGVAAVAEKASGLLHQNTTDQSSPALRLSAGYFSRTGIPSPYRPTYVTSLMRDPVAAQIFCHFLISVGPSLSIYERHPKNPPESLMGAQIPGSLRGLWTDILPTIALKNQALLHAMLALSSFNIAKLSSTRVSPSLMHYHFALRWLSKKFSVPTERNNLGTTAAVLLLGYFEATNADHRKWMNHLLGAKQILIEIDIGKIGKQINAGKIEIGPSKKLNDG